MLGIRHEAVLVDGLRGAAGQTERLVSICQQAGADTYVSGPSARAYLDAECFAAAGIALQYFDYAGYPEYPQLFPPFEHHVSVDRSDLQHGADARRVHASPLTMRCRSSRHCTGRRRTWRSSTPGSARRRPRSPTTTKSFWSTTDRPTTRSTIALRCCAGDPRLRVVDLSRNFGHHKAMMTGLAHARGDLVFLIDSDLEEEPELLPTF